MTIKNRSAGLAFVWQRGYDSPLDGYHVTPGDAGGGTLGGVTEATWTTAQRRGQAPMAVDLRNATAEQLSVVLMNEFWGGACDALPAGLDLLVFNGRMMSGEYLRLFQDVVGVTPDGDIGPETLAAAQRVDLPAAVLGLTVLHLFYLSKLGDSWTEFHNGWIKRVLVAQKLAEGTISQVNEQEKPV